MATETTTTTTTPVKAAPKKRKSKRSVSKGIMHVQATYNNTIVTVTDEQGNVLSNASAGSCGFRGARKNTAYAAQVASERALTAASQIFGLQSVKARVSGVGQGRDAALRATIPLGLELVSITDTTSTPFGGCRPRRAPRK